MITTLVGRGCQYVHPQPWSSASSLYKKNGVLITQKTSSDDNLITHDKMITLEGRGRQYVHPQPWSSASGLQKEKGFENTIGLT